MEKKFEKEKITIMKTVALLVSFATIFDSIISCVTDIALIVTPKSSGVACVSTMCTSSLEGRRTKVY